MKRGKGVYDRCLEKGPLVGRTAPGDKHTRQPATCMRKKGHDGMHQSWDGRHWHSQLPLNLDEHP
jgi:hypothetical protein